MAAGARQVYAGALRLGGTADDYHATQIRIAIAGHREARDSDQPVVQSARRIGRGSHHHRGRRMRAHVPPATAGATTTLEQYVSANGMPATPSLRHIEPIRPARASRLEYFFRIRGAS